MKKHFKNLISVFLVLSLVLSFGTTIFAEEASEKPFSAATFMTKETYVAADGTLLPYRLYVPSDYNPEKEYSFLLFLHGTDNRGNDNESQLSVNNGLLDRIIHGEKIKFADNVIDSSKEFIIVSPQCALNSQWVDISYANTTDPSYNLSETPMSVYMTAVVELIEKCKKDYTLNAERMYVTGLSMGGFGTWDLLARYPDLFAAAIPISGAGDYSKASVIANTPVWTFHQLQDPNVSSAGTLKMVEALLDVGGEVKFTPYFDGVHDAWTNAYAEPELLQWLYNHTKTDKIRVAFVGDSITEGATLKDVPNEAYSALIAKELGDNCIVGNFGKSATSALSTAVKPYIKSEEYADALLFKPDVLHIMLGTNDIKNENWDEGKDNFVGDYLNIINSFKAINPNVKVYIGIPPRIFKENVFGTRSPKILEEEGIPAIKQVAKEADATLINYFDPLKDSGELFTDFLHPNAGGHKIIAETALKTITIPEKQTEIKKILAGVSDVAKSEVALSYAAGIVPENITSDYNANITRLDFCRMVVNALPKDLPETESALFEDCDDPSVSYAYAIGVVNGVSKKSFAPEKAATRQEMAAMLYRAYKLIAPSAKPDSTSNAPDRKNVDNWAAEAIDFLSEADIMKGDSNGLLKPFDFTTAEEAILLVYRTYCNANRYEK